MYVCVHLVHSRIRITISDMLSFYYTYVSAENAPIYMYSMHIFQKYTPKYGVIFGLNAS